MIFPRVIKRKDRYCPNNKIAFMKFKHSFHSDPHVFERPPTFRVGFRSEKAIVCTLFFLFFLYIDKASLLATEYNRNVV